MVENESLFSLEVVVESLENVVVPCLEPAIAFRLLDYPTLLIQKDQCCQMSNQESGTYNFYTGKSCLFKMNKDILLSNLEKTPLYVMLVDVSGSRAKLLASTTIPLMGCFERVLKNIEISGLDVPTVQGNKGIFELYNLMGTPVALTKLCYRIFSLGGTINGHVKCEEPKLAKPLVSNKVRHDVDEKLKSKSELNAAQEFNCDYTNENLVTGENGKNTDERMEELIQKKSISIPQVNIIETQTDIFCEEPMSINKRTIEAAKKSTRKENINVTKPPPLYYNSKCIPDIPQTLMNISRESIRLVEETASGETEQVARQVRPKVQYQTVSVQTTDQIKTNDKVPGRSPLHRQDTTQGDFIDLPLINALLRELSIAQQNVTNNRPPEQANAKNNIHKPSYHVKPQSIPLPSKTFHKPAIKKIPVNQGRFQKTKTTHSKGVLIQRNPIKFKKSALKCHTTKTQKLREALNRRQNAENMPVLRADDSIVNKQDHRRPKSMKTRFAIVPPKETCDFACQVAFSEDNSKADVPKRQADVKGTSYDGPGHKEAGIQVCDTDNVHVVVQQSDLVQFNKEDLLLTHEDKAPVSQSVGFEKFPGIGFPDELSQTNEPNNEHISQPGSNSEWSSYSRKSTPRPAVLESTEPTFSNFSPTPRVKNSRYNKKENVHNLKESQSSSENELSSKTDLVAKPVTRLSNVSSIEHNYSHDKFDSFESGHTTSTNSSKEI